MFFSYYTDWYNKKTETSKCIVVHGSSGFTGATWNCHRVLTQVMNSFISFGDDWLVLLSVGKGCDAFYTPLIAICLLPDFLYHFSYCEGVICHWCWISRIFRGSLFKTLHKNYQALDIKRRLRMALDVVCSFSLFCVFMCSSRDSRVRQLDFISCQTNCHTNPSTAGKRDELFAP